MDPNENKPQSDTRPGLLCEDADALEVRGADGRNRIEKTNDRDGLAKSLAETDGGAKPAHKPVNG